MGVPFLLFFLGRNRGSPYLLGSKLWVSSFSLGFLTALLFFDIEIEFQFKLCYFSSLMHFKYSAASPQAAFHLFHPFQHTDKISIGKFIKMRYLDRLLILFAILSTGLAGMAQTESEKEESKEEPEIHETVAVWGTKVKTTSVRLDGEGLEMKQADHISDLLRTIPGVDVGGAHSLNQRITIRSMDDKDLRISIDGANQNTYMYHHMGNLQIHADILKSVDLSVGKNSVLNGSLGGTVQFETKDANDLLGFDQSIGARLQTSYGDNASSGFSLTGYGKISNKMDFLAYYNRVNHDNFDVGGGVIKDENGMMISGTDGTVRGHEGKLDDGLVKLGWDLNNRSRVTLAFETYEDRGDFSYRPDMGLATDLAIAENLGLPLVYPTNFSRDTVTLNYKTTLPATINLKATAFFNQSDLWRDESGVAAVFGGASIIEGKAENTGFKALADKTFGQSVLHKLVFGGELVDYDTLSRNDDIRISRENATQTSLYIEDQIQISPNFKAIPGIRYDRYNLDANVVNNTYTEITSGLALNLDISQAFALRASATQLFKGPEIGEVFLGAGINDTPNPDIDPETGLNAELGFSYSESAIGADRFSLGATGFRTQIDDYIYDYASAPGIRSWKDNVGDMAIEGLEAYIGYDVGSFRSLLTASVADSELSAFADYSELDGARLDRIQGDTYSLDLSYNFIEQNLHLKWTSMAVAGVGSGLDLDGASLNNAKDSYVIHNLSLRWLPPSLRGLAVNFGVDNLFDKFYASQSSRTGVSAHPRFGNLYLLDYEPGRNIKATVSYQF